MRKNISFKALQSFIRLLNLLKDLDLLNTIDYLVTWEKRPQMVLSQGEIEFEDPQDIYGCSIVFFDEFGQEVRKVRFSVEAE